jgi:release factor glutamine methyltransferase
MTTKAFLDKATATLQQAGIESARLDALVLLEDAVGRDRALLLAHPEHVLPRSTEENLNKKLARRAAHTPLAYVRGMAPFYGREFVVNEHTLVPRPETETLIGLFLELLLPPAALIADVGTGSGCIGITAVLERPQTKALLIDNSALALRVAQQNTTKLGTRQVRLLQNDLLRGITEPPEVVFANLPYVPESYPINQAAQHEPAGAIFSGPDGFDHFRRLWQQLSALPHRPHWVITESLVEQHTIMVRLAISAGYKLSRTQQLAQLFETA